MIDTEQHVGLTTAVSPHPANNQFSPPSGKQIIQLQDVTKIYKTGSGDFTALKNISLDIYRGEFLGIMGKSGAGKTTLLNMIAGISEITSGEVLFYPPDADASNGRAPRHINKLKEDDLAVWRGHNLGVIYQSFELLPQLDLVTNIMLPVDFAGRYQTKISKKRALELLEIVELTPHAYKLPAHISGGQMQRVAIARALVNEPAILIADEPTGSLDTVTSETIFKIFEKLVAQGKTIIMVSHDMNLASRFTRRLYISDGAIVDEIPLEQPNGQTEQPSHTARPETNTALKTAATPPTQSPTSPQSAATFYKGKGMGKTAVNQNQPAIHLQKVVKTYVNAAGKFTALKGIDLQLNYGQFVSIVGKSGSGKSTLLNMLTGIDHPTSGDVIIGGDNIYKMSESQRAKWRGRNMGIVFQFFQLLPTLSLLENVMLPMDYSNMYSASERPQRALELLKMVGLEDHIYDLPLSVSNGQQQSAAIARSMATDPPIIVADEPTGNLDSRSANNIYRVFQELADRGKTILIVTHDPSLTSRTDQTVIISDGEIIDKTVARALPLLDHPLMLHATRQAERRTVPSGETIVRQGEPVSHFYMVVEGAVNIIIQRNNQEASVARLGPGQFFGEVELLADRQSIASVHAAEGQPVELALLPKNLFHKLIEQSPPTEAEIQHVAEARQAENLSHGERMKV